MHFDCIPLELENFVHAISLNLQSIASYCMRVQLASFINSTLPGSSGDNLSYDKIIVISRCLPVSIKKTFYADSLLYSDI